MLSGRKYCYFLAGWLIAILPCTLVFPQILPFKFYTIQDGLPSNLIHNIFQDSKGFIWVCTNNGISVFDGISFKNYSKADGLQENEVVNIFEIPSQQGTLYIQGFQGSLTVSVNDKFTPLVVYNSNDFRGFEYVCKGNNDEIFGVAENKLYIIRDCQAVGIQLPFTFQDTRDINRIMVSEDDGVWVSDGQDFYYCQFTDKRRVERTHKIHFEAPISRAIQNVDGGIFILLDNLEIIEARRGKILHRRKTDEDIIHLYDDGHGKLWLGTHTGVRSIDKNNIETASLISYSSREGLIDKEVGLVFVDRENNLWACTRNNGIALLSARGMVYYPIDNAIVADDVRSTTVDQHGNIWVNSKQGVWQFYLDTNGVLRKKFHVLPSPPGVIYADPDGGLWVVFLKKELRFFRSTLISRYIIEGVLDSVRLRLHKSFDYPVDLPITHYGMFLLFQDSQKRMWASINGYGVVVYDPVTLTRICSFMPDTGAPGPSVRRIYEDKSGTIWLAGFNEGLGMIDGKLPLTGKAKIFTEKDGLPENRVRTICEDSKGRIWIGTRNNGIGIYDKGHFLNISQKDGLLSSAVWYIIQDRNKRMWINTSIGLECVEESTLTVIERKSYLTGVKVQGSGILSNRYLWSLNSYEVVVEDLMMEEKDTLAHPIYIKSFHIGGLEQDLSRHQSFPYSQNRCSFDYIGLCYKNPTDLRYQTLLEGADSTWSKLTKSRSITYAALDPGTYTFHVRAIGLNGIPSNTSAKYIFTISPPYWGTWWFRLLTASIFLIAGPVIYYYRVSKLKKKQRLQEQFSRKLIQTQEQERKRIAVELHDGLGQELMIIANKAQFGLDADKPEDSKLRFKQISDSVSASIAIVREITFNLTPYQIEQLGLTASLRSMIEKVASSSAIIFTWSIPELEGCFNKEAEINIYRIVQECLNNIIKHSQATETIINIVVSGQAVEIVIRDNGKGFDLAAIQSKEKKGLGLKSLQERVTILQGSWSIETTQNLGVTFLCSIPKSNNDG